MQSNKYPVQQKNLRKGNNKVNLKNKNHMAPPNQRVSRKYKFHCIAGRGKAGNPECRTGGLRDVSPGPALRQGSPSGSRQYLCLRGGGGRERHL